MVAQTPNGNDLLTARPRLKVFFLKSTLTILACSAPTQVSYFLALFQSVPDNSGELNNCIAQYSWFVFALLDFCREVKGNYW